MCKISQSINELSTGHHPNVWWVFDETLTFSMKRGQTWRKYNYTTSCDVNNIRNIAIHIALISIRNEISSHHNFFLKIFFLLKNDKIVLEWKLFFTFYVHQDSRFPLTRSLSSPCSVRKLNRKRASLEYWNASERNKLLLVNFYANFVVTSFTATSALV